MSEHAFVFEVKPQTQVIFAPAGDGVSAGMKTVTSSGEYGYARVEPVTPEDIDLAAYAGRYTSPELDITWTIVPGDDCLTVRRRKYVDSHPTPLFNDAFRDDWAPLLGYPRTYLIRFTRDAHGAIEGLTVSGDGVRNLRFERTR